MDSGEDGCCCCSEFSEHIRGMPYGVRRQAIPIKTLVLFRFQCHQLCILKSVFWVESLHRHTLFF